MTDNEKRAHDLAIAAIPLAADQLRTTSSSEVRFDIDQAYLNLYQSFLKVMREHFPESE